MWDRAESGRDPTVPSPLFPGAPQGCSLDLHLILLLWPLQGRCFLQPCLLVLGVVPFTGHVSWAAATPVCGASIEKPWLGKKCSLLLRSCSHPSHEEMVLGCVALLVPGEAHANHMSCFPWGVRIWIGPLWKTCPPRDLIPGLPQLELKCRSSSLSRRAFSGRPRRVV